MLALKTDAGSGALEQMVLAEFCAAHFKEHVPKLTRGLRAKLETLMEALAEQFGTAAEFDDPKGGIFLWVKLPDVVDTQKLAQAGARRRRRDQPRARMVDRQGLRQEPAAPVFRPSLQGDHPPRRRRARRGLPSGVRRAEPDRQRRATREQGGLGAFTVFRRLR